MQPSLCCSEEWTDLVRVNRDSCMERSDSSGKDSLIQLHLKDEGNSFEDSNVHVLAREEKWLERGVKEAMFVKLEKPSGNGGGGFQDQLSAASNAVLGSSF